MEKEVNPLTQYPTRHALNEDQIRFRYDLEQQTMDAITAGKYTLIQDLLETDTSSMPFDPTVRRMPNDPLRDRKNGLIIRNTFCRIAARDGGLPPVYLHLISEKYALKIEQARSVDYLNNTLSPQMVKEYCEAVAHFSTSGYSPVTKQVVSYIANHSTEPLSLKEVADHFHINAAHLSRKFKKETGFTFVDYVNYQRVEHAKLLFHEGYTSVTEAAGLSGFNSSSYFSKVFKKATGESPKKYLKHSKE